MHHLPLIPSVSSSYTRFATTLILFLCYEYNFFSPRRIFIFPQDYFLSQTQKLKFQTLKLEFQTLELMFQTQKQKILLRVKTFPPSFRKFSLINSKNIKEKKFVFRYLFVNLSAIPRIKARLGAIRVSKEGIRCAFKVAQ